MDFGLGKLGTPCSQENSGSEVLTGDNPRGPKQARTSVMLVGIGDASRAAMRRVDAAPRGSREFPDAGVPSQSRGLSGLGGQSGVARVTNLGDVLVRHTKIRLRSIAVSTTGRRAVTAVLSSGRTLPGRLGSTALPRLLSFSRGAVGTMWGSLRRDRRLGIRVVGHGCRDLRTLRKMRRPVGVLKRAALLCPVSAAHGEPRAEYHL